MDLIWEQVVVDAHDPVALGRLLAEALGWVVVGDAADEFEIRPTSGSGAGPVVRAGSRGEGRQEQTPS
jgi:hypothetical protein